MANKQSEVTHGEIMEKIGQLESRCDAGCGNKKIPLGFAATILIQTFAAIWWAASISGTINHMKVSSHLAINETEVKNFIAEREKAYMEMDNNRHLEMSNRMTQVEGQFNFIEKTLDRIERKLMVIDGRDPSGRINRHWGNTNVPLSSRSAK